MRSSHRIAWALLCCCLATSSRAEASEPLTAARKLESVGITRVSAGYSTSASWAIASVALQNLCIACESYGPPPPTDYRPL